jgi:hypothetical protein
VPSWERLDAASKSTGIFRNNTVYDFLLLFVSLFVCTGRRIVAAQNIIEAEALIDKKTKK